MRNPSGRTGTEEFPSSRGAPFFTGKVEMNRQSFLTFTLSFCVVGILFGAPADSGQRAIDTKSSTLTVRVEKTGIFSALGHNHEITATIDRGSVDLNTHQVTLYAKSASLNVRDQDTSEKDRAQIQATMAGPEVLDVETYPEIVFRSTGAQPAGAGVWKVSGSLSLHGRTHPVDVSVQEKNGHYVGTSQFRQTDFGMKPVKVAGGTVQVKDEVRIEFDIQLAP
jgi:polyisoprenoid-binding protein YceI